MCCLCSMHLATTIQCFSSQDDDEVWCCRSTVLCRNARMRPGQDDEGGDDDDDDDESDEDLGTEHLLAEQVPCPLQLE